VTPPGIDPGTVRLVAQRLNPHEFCHNLCKSALTCNYRLALNTRTQNEFHAKIMQRIKGRLCRPDIRYLLQLMENLHNKIISYLLNAYLTTLV
jgi:hypothetical protein